jgi:hypothetical protein
MSDLEIPAYNYNESNSILKIGDHGAVEKVHAIRYKLYTYCK